MSKSTKKSKTSHKRDVRKQANRSVRKEVRYILKNNEVDDEDFDFDDMPDELEITHKTRES